MSIFQSQTKSVAQFASGLYGYALGAPTNNAVLAEAGLTGLNSIFNSYYAQTFSALSADSVASLLVSNVGIVAGQNGLNAAQVAEAVKYVKGQLTAAAATGTQGQVAASLLIGFSSMAADPVFGAAARAWNTQVDRDMAYTASGALLDVPVALAIVPTPPTPVAETYTVASNAPVGGIEEGDSVVYTVTTTGVAAGTTLAYIVSGTGNAFDSKVSGLVTINTEGKGFITVNTADDAIVGNDGVLTIQVIGNNQTIVSTTPVVVDSEDVPPETLAPTYAVSASNVNEGGQAVFTVTTENVAPGTVLSYHITGTGSAAAVDVLGTVTVRTDGTAPATFTAPDNDIIDTGRLTFTLVNVAGTPHATINVVDNGDTNARTLTTGDDDFDMHNYTQDLVFNATVGYYDSETTLTDGDVIIGGSGTDTLNVVVASQDAYFWELNNNEPALQSIENVILDTTSHGIHDDADSWGEDGTIVLWNEDAGPDTSFLDAEYFDTERTYGEDGSVETAGSLEKITIRDFGNDESPDGEFEDVFLHKNMTVAFAGSDVAYEAGELNEDVALGEDVTEVTVELSGVGGDQDDEGEVSLTFSQDYWNEEENLESLTITGNLAKTYVNHGSFVHDQDDAAFVLKGEDYFDDNDGPIENDFQSITPDTITISFETTDDVTNVGVAFDSLVFGSGGYDNSVLEDVSLIDFSASTANITSYVTADQFNDGSDVASEVTIKDGLGDDVLTLDVGDGGRTAITLDLGTSTADVNTVVLTNWNYTNFNGSSGGNGNIDLDATIAERFSDQDLTEDLIIIDNFNIKSGANDTSYDELYMPTIVMAGEDYSSGGDFGWDGHFAGVEAPFVLRTENEYTEAAQAAADDASTGNKFFAAVDAVAELLLSNTDSDYSDAWIDTGDLLTNYAAAFEYEGDMYIYVDANRIYDETFDFDNWDSDYENLGLSNGDILIKLTGITSVVDVVSNDQYPLFS